MESVAILKRRAACVAWNKAHPEKRDAYSRAWKLRNPDKVIQSGRDRRLGKGAHETDGKR